MWIGAGLMQTKPGQGAGLESVGVESSCSTPRLIIPPERALGARAGLLSAFGGNGWGGSAVLCPDGAGCVNPGIGVDCDDRGFTGAFVLEDGFADAAASMAGDCSIGLIPELTGGAFSILFFPIRKSRSVSGVRAGITGLVQVLVNAVVEQARNSQPSVPGTGGGSLTVN